MSRTLEKLADLTDKKADAEKEIIEQTAVVLIDAITNEDREALLRLIGTLSGHVSKDTIQLLSSIRNKIF
ncbi:hypothetical protein [Vibrio barjaei]|uniref:hypothetical protein n=1 Tax=Vibrio barjaei TaxID=1676683 RepID=UPI00228396D8|nr:hypothetical protein [Vibrio barjaei]MCY9870495.1 hypothetical protein [Vibrio barjaei]